jgi:alkylation response protein AidB-like acyl-CoA dehydrogenase
MDFTLPPHVEAFRKEIKAIVDETITPEIIDRCHETGVIHSYELAKALADRGHLAAAVPGLGEKDPIELFTFFNELEKAGAPFDGLAVTMLVAGVVNAVGTDFQKQAVLPRLLSGEANICLGYSEPDNGSDVAGITTKAERDGDQWVINGQKMWTSLAQIADWVILLTRTNPDVPKHKGLTMFLVPMDTPGIEVQPVHTMGFETTNATFYDNVRIGDEWRLGDVDGGWRVMGVALAFERGVMGGTNPCVALLRHMHHWATSTLDADGVPISADPVLRERMARVAIENEVARLMPLRAAWIAATGGMPGLEGSMAKVYATENYQKASRWFSEAAGPAGLLRRHEAGAAAEGWIENDARHVPVTTIYGGTSEINRNNVAERHLGLPKARK